MNKTIGDGHAYVQGVLGGPIREPDVYEKFLDSFIKKVVTRAVWEGSKGNEHYVNIVTVSDEAFAIIALENGYEKWMDELAGKVNCDKKDKVNAKRVEEGKEILTNDQVGRPCKYTKGGTGTQGEQGWSPAGIARFNTIATVVTVWRMKPRGKDFYDRLSEKYAEEYRNGRKRKGDDDNETNAKRVLSGEELEEAARNMMESGDDDITLDLL